MVESNKYLIEVGGNEGSLDLGRIFVFFLETYSQN
jgi:hypothetical protein